ncbi:uncharacterized protein VK521_018043 [Ammospiza maritima maritima]
MCKVLHQSWDNPQNQYNLGDEWIEKKLAKKLARSQGLRPVIAADWRPPRGPCSDPVDEVIGPLDTNLPPVAAGSIIGAALPVDPELQLLSPKESSEGGVLPLPDLLFAVRLIVCLPLPGPHHARMAQLSPQLWQRPSAPLHLLIFCLLLPPWAAWIVPQPKVNVWRTLAQALGQDHICLDAASAEDPMSSCLVGIPFSPGEFPSAFQSALSPILARSLTILPSFDSSNAWRDGVVKLDPLPSEPTELHLLGSANSSICFQFEYTFSSIEKGSEVVQQNKAEYQAYQWCKAILKISGPTTTGRTPYALPRGAFLICGDRAWAGIPSGLIGGPCTLGKLTLFTPNMTQIVNWKKTNITAELARSKRDLKDLPEDCDDEITHWSHSKTVAFTILLPWVSVAKSLGELGRLECWVVKQANLTSAAIYDLLTDEEITRKATLQNRAAIDFLLLLHHHQCEEFEGLCCMNLSSRAENVRHTILKMKDQVHQMEQETSDWLRDIFKGWGLGSWASSVLESVMKVVLVLFLLLICFSLVRGLVQRLVNKITAPSVNQVVAGESAEGDTYPSEAEETADEEELAAPPLYHQELCFEEEDAWTDQPRNPAF